jgi:hypothetical protein
MSEVCCHHVDSVLMLHRVSKQLGKYKYLRLPMGLKYSPDIAQAAMENVLLVLLL